jgi:hypothetical protein
LVWYSRDPKRFEKIYVRVLNQLTYQLDIAKAGNLTPEVLFTFSTVELWNDSTHFVLKNDSSARNKLAFTIIDSTLMMQDLYILRFYQRVMPEDSCANQRIYFNVHYASGQVDSLKRFVQNDGKLRRYTFRLIADRKEKIDSLTGRFFATDSCLFAQNAYIKNISLTREFNPEIQDELREKTEKMERFRTFEYRLFPMLNERRNVTNSAYSFP